MTATADFLTAWGRDGAVPEGFAQLRHSHCEEIFQIVISFQLTLSLLRKDSLSQYRKGHLSNRSTFQVPTSSCDWEKGTISLPLVEIHQQLYRGKPIVTFTPHSYPPMYRWTSSSNASGTMQTQIRLDSTFDIGKSFQTTNLKLMLASPLKDSEF